MWAKKTAFVEMSKTSYNLFSNPVYFLPALIPCNFQKNNIIKWSRDWGSSTETKGFSQEGLATFTYTGCLLNNVKLFIFLYYFIKQILEN